MRCLERKKDNATQHNRKTKQHNTTRPRQLFFKEKTASGGITEAAQLAGLESHIQYKATKAPQASQTR